MAQTAQASPAVCRGPSDLDRRIERLSATLLALPEPFVDVAFPHSFDQTGSFALALREYSRLPKEQQLHYLQASQDLPRVTNANHSASTSSAPLSRSTDTAAAKAAGHVGLTPNRSSTSTTSWPTQDAKAAAELPGRLHSDASPRSIVNAVKQQGLQAGELAHRTAPADLVRPLRPPPASQPEAPPSRPSNAPPSNPHHHSTLPNPRPTAPKPAAKPSSAPHPHSSDPPKHQSTRPQPHQPPKATPPAPTHAAPHPTPHPNSARQPASKPPTAPPATLPKPAIRLQPPSPTKRPSTSQHPTPAPPPKQPRLTPLEPPAKRPPPSLPDRPRPPQTTFGTQTSPPHPPPTSTSATDPMPLPLNILHVTHAANALLSQTRTAEDTPTPPAKCQQLGKQYKHQGDRERAKAGGRWTTAALSSYVDSALCFLEAARQLPASHSGQARELLTSTAQMLNTTWTEPPPPPAPRDPPLKPPRLLLQLLLCQLQAAAYSHALLLAAPQPLDTLRQAVASLQPAPPTAAPSLPQPAAASRPAVQHASSQAPASAKGHQRPSPGDSNASTQDRIETSPPFRDPPPAPSQPRRTFGNPRRSAVAPQPAQPAAAPPSSSMHPMLALDLLDTTRGMLDAHARAAQLAGRLLPLAWSLPTAYAAFTAIQALGVQGMQAGFRERLLVARRALGLIKQVGQAPAAEGSTPLAPARLSLGSGSGVLEMEAAARGLTATPVL